MNKMFLTLAVILFAFVVNAQNKVFDMMKYKGDKTASFVVTDSAGNKTFFDIDEESIHCSLNRGDRTKLTAARPDKKYKDILGCQLSGDVYTVYFSNSWHTDLASVSFNFKTNKTEQYLIPLDLSKESYFSSFINHNKLYFITRLKDAMGIRIFTFTQGDQFTTNTLTFKNIDTGLSSFYTALSPDNIAKSDVGSSSDEFKTAEFKTKNFIIDDNLYITLDQSDYSTTVIKVDLKSYENNVLVYAKNTDVCGENVRPGNSSTAGGYSTAASTSYVNSNSFMYGDKLFQLTSCSSGFNLKIRNITDGKIIKQYTAMKDSEISFKNSTIVQQELGSYKKEKELTPKQFMRKLSNNKCFVYVSGRGKNLSVSLGCFKYNTTSIPTTPGGGMMMGATTESLIYFSCTLQRETLEAILY